MAVLCGAGTEKAPRQIVLMYVGTELAGFLQCYINGGVFMVEEIQIRRDYWVSSLPASLWKFMVKNVPGDTEMIEAYADRRNFPSQKLMGKLGMQPIRETSDGSFVHFRGNAESFFHVNGR